MRGTFFKGRYNQKNVCIYFYAILLFQKPKYFGYCIYRYNLIKFIKLKGVTPIPPNDLLRINLTKIPFFSNFLCICMMNTFYTSTNICHKHSLCIVLGVFRFTPLCVFFHMVVFVCFQAHHVT